MNYDYIVVGAGSGGGMAAMRLSDNPDLRVLLLEAGGSDRHWTTQMPAGARYTFTGGPRNWCFETEPEPYMNNRVLFQPRGKVLGGSSSLNGMVYVRGHARDYAEWAESGATGWAYADVLEYFRSIERYSEGADEYRGGTGPISVQKLKDNHPIEEAFIEAGIQAGYPSPPDYNAQRQEGVSAFDANIDAGWRCGTARGCIRPAMGRANLTVMMNTHVTRVDIDHGRAVGVRYRQSNEEVSVRAEREVILSAGAFQTPQILMLSGIGPADHLRKHGIEVTADLPGVGENLQDHLECHLKFDCPHRGMTKNKLTARHRIVLAGIQWYLFKTGAAASTHSRVGGFFASSDAATHPDIQFHFWPYYLDDWSIPANRDGYCFDVGPVRSASRGWVRLRSADPFDAPRIQLNGLSQAEDFSVFRRSIEIARDIASQRAFDFCRGRELVPGAEVRSDAELDEYVRNHANSAYHPCGTAKMGTDPLAVCDARARVHGVAALRVADASLMPRITNGNINAPCIMIGEKVSHMILNGD